MADGKGIPLLGDRGAFDTANYPLLHAADIADESYVYHLPPVGSAGQVLTVVGSAWAAADATGGGGAVYLDDLEDVYLVSPNDPADGDVLAYDSAAGWWTSWTPSLSGMSDVYIDTPADGDVLTWSDANNRWEAAAPGAGSAHVIEDPDGYDMPQEAYLMFSGANVEVLDVDAYDRTLVRFCYGAYTGTLDVVTSVNTLSYYTKELTISEGVITAVGSPVEHVL